MGVTYERRLRTSVIPSRPAPPPAADDSAVALPTTTAFTGIVRAPEASGDAPPRHIPLSTSLRALPCVPSSLVVCAGHPEPCPAVTGGSGFTIEISSDFGSLAISMILARQPALRCHFPLETRWVGPTDRPISSR